MSKNPNDVRVVVTGIGTINPIGNTVDEFWDNLAVGKSGIRTIQNVDIEDYNIKIAGEVDLPDIVDYFEQKKMAKRLDRYVVYAHIAGTQALRDSGLDIERAPHRYGSLIGSGDGGVGGHLENVTRINTRGMNYTSPFFIVNVIPNTGSGFFAKSWNLQGPSLAVSSACATSNHAVGIGSMMIKMGMVDAIFAGGAEAAINKSGLSAFGNIFALSERCDSPETASRPFDIDRDGFVLGEGAGVLCLEELEHAKSRGAHIYCEVTGYGFSCDAYDLVAPHPDARGAAQSISAAIQFAQLNAEDIGLINCHGTSTPLGDIAEFRAAQQVFGDYSTKIPVHSTKSMIGHSLGAAGGIEAVAVIMAFERGLVHETTNQFKQDPEIGFNVVKNGPMERKIDHALSDGFGFGGQNAALILSRYKN